VYPPVPVFYALPRTLEEMIDHTVGRALDLFDIDTGTVRRWDPGKGEKRRSRK
jgi:4-hydroxy-3-polyprenylbenzoate decarboxylase